MQHVVYLVFFQEIGLLYSLLWGKAVYRDVVPYVVPVSTAGVG